MGFKHIYQISNTKMATGASQVKEKSEANRSICAIENFRHSTPEECCHTGMQACCLSVFTFF